MNAMLWHASLHPEKNHVFFATILLSVDKAGSLPPLSSWQTFMIYPYKDSLILFINSLLSPCLPPHNRD